MDANDGSGAVDRQEINRQIAEAYQKILDWMAENLEIEAEDAREPLHVVILRVLSMRAPRIRDCEHYLTRAAVREHKRSLGNGTKPVLFSDLHRDEREYVQLIPAPGPSPTELAADNEIVAFSKDEIEKMPPRRRDVMRLFFGVLSPEEIAATLGMKAATVRSHIRYVMAKLRKKFGVAHTRRQKPRTGGGAGRPTAPRKESRDGGNDRGGFSRTSERRCG